MDSQFKINIIPDYMALVSVEEKRILAKYLNNFKLSVDSINSVLEHNSACQSILHLTIRQKHMSSMVKLLINNGADINIIDGNGLTPLMIAVLLKEFEYVKLLVDYGCDVNIKNNKGTTALLLSFRHHDIFEYLVKNGADACIAMENSWTILMLCVRNSINVKEKIDLLLKYNKNLDIDQRNNKGMTALMIISAYWKKNSNSSEIIKYLIKLGSDVSLKDNKGQNALMIAAIYSNELSSYKAVETLLECGADINAIDNEGKTCLELAIQSDKSDNKVIELLKMRK